MDRWIAFVAADAGSTYEPYPILKYSWNPAPFQKRPSAQAANSDPQSSNPMTQHHGIHEDDEQLKESNLQERTVSGTELDVYSGRSG